MRERALTAPREKPRAIKDRSPSQDEEQGPGNGKWEVRG